LFARPHPEDWRELCAAAAKEPDSDKLFSLVIQILKAFDDQKGATSSSSDSTSSEPAGNRG
jgi:hypothetical protein